MTTRWLASVLVATSLIELAILRIGTRTAIHVPGLERVAGPYRLLAATGRLAYFVASVMLVMLLGYVTLELHRRRRMHASACLISFMVMAGVGALHIVGSEVMTTAVVTTIAVLAVVVLAHQDDEMRVVVGLFATAFLLGALPGIVQSGSSSAIPAVFRQLPRAAETLAVAAAIGSGPMARRSLGLMWHPARRMAWISGGVGLVTTATIPANPSTVHILMLWNFGLTGALPAAAYGLAAASLTMAVASYVRCSQPILALTLMLLFLGGIGLTSTYQSGLVVAGLGLADLASTRRPADATRGHAVRSG